MLIKNTSALLGPELEFVNRIDIDIQNNKFQRIGNKLESTESINCEGLLMIPGFINAHTHIGDSIGKDIATHSVDHTVHPVFGVKSKILKETSNDLMINFMRNTIHAMIRKGITTFVDFREGGSKGVFLLKRALDNTPIRAIILGRVESYATSTDIRQDQPPSAEFCKNLDDLVDLCDGIGLSGANENNNSTIHQYAQTSKLRAIHAAETRESIMRSKKTSNNSEVTRALYLKPHFLVHMTWASKSDLDRAAKNTRGIVVCPRANGVLAAGIPNIIKMKDMGCTISLGTDNVMINSPDMFREMDYIWKIMMATHRYRINPREIIKMATVNGGKIIDKNFGTIQVGKLADCIFIDKHALDLEPMHDPYAAIVHRASESTIRAVMINGVIVHGKL